MDRAAGLALYARQWLGDDAAVAEDVVQEALTSLLPQTPPPSDPIAWMYRAVRNAAIDQARSSSRRRRREQTVAESRREWFESSADALIDAKIAASRAGRPAAGVARDRRAADLERPRFRADRRRHADEPFDRSRPLRRRAAADARRTGEQPCSPKNDTTTRTEPGGSRAGSGALKSLAPIADERDRPDRRRLRRRPAIGATPAPRCGNPPPAAMLLIAVGSWLIRVQRPDERAAVRSSRPSQTPIVVVVAAPRLHRRRRSSHSLLMLQEAVRERGADGLPETELPTIRNLRVADFF